MFELPESTKAKSVHNLTPSDEVLLENVVFSLNEDHQSGEMMDIDQDVNENDDGDVDEEDETV